MSISDQATSATVPRDPERRTMSVPEWAHIIGVSPWLAYQEASRTGQIAGVSVLKVGRRMVIPRDAAERVLAGDTPPHNLRADN